MFDYWCKDLISPCVLAYCKCLLNELCVRSSSSFVGTFIERAFLQFKGCVCGYISRLLLYYKLYMKQLTVEEIKQKTIPVLKKAGIKRSSLFGSYVRGEQTEKSDVDLLVEYPKHTSLFDVVELKNNLEDALGKSVDLVGFNVIKPRLKQYILPSQVQLF